MPIIIGIGGFTSQVGKTTLLCDLLQFFPGWEAIKTTRGHYRSCGKDAQTCCVSHLLDNEPVIHSGRSLTYMRGKDTGRYWDAGAVNVHWVIGTDGQIADGVAQALRRVKSTGVFIEGNSFTNTIEPDFFVMVALRGAVKIKATARRALERVSAFYLSGEAESGTTQAVRALVSQFDPSFSSGNKPVFTHTDLQQLIGCIQEINPQIAA